MPAAAGCSTTGAATTLDRSTVDGNVVLRRRPAPRRTVAGAGVERARSGRSVRRRSAGTARRPRTPASAADFWLASNSSVTNSTVASNRVSAASAQGGGIGVSSNFSLTSSTIARNVAKMGGGLSVGGGPATLRGSVVAQNSATTGRDCFGPIGSSGFNLIGSTPGCTFTHVASDRRNLAAKLGLLGVERRPDPDRLVARGEPGAERDPEGAVSDGEGPAPRQAPAGHALRHRRLRTPHVDPLGKPLRPCQDRARAHDLRLGILAIVGLALASPASAAILNVNCATQSLQARIDAAAAGSILRIKGTCVGRFVVSKNLTLDGNPHATLDGAQLGKTLSVIGTVTVLVTDLTVTGGHYVAQNSAGGGISHSGGNLTLRRVTVTGNTVGGTGGTTGSASGAGVYSSSVGSLSIFDSFIRGNTAVASVPSGSSAGGAGISRAGNLRVENTVVSGNVAIAYSGSNAQARGGGISAASGVLTILGSRVTGNRAVAQAPVSGGAVAVGGGVYGTGGPQSVIVRRSQVSGNRVSALGAGPEATTFGGGIAAFGSSLRIEDSRVEGNSLDAHNTGASGATTSGGGVFSSAVTLTVLRSRITGSRSSARTNGAAQANGVGGGLYAFGGGTTVVRQARITGNRISVDAAAHNATAQGGGLYQSNGTLTIEATTLDANRLVSRASGSAVSIGGGLQSVSAALTMRTTTVSRNVADAGSTAVGGGMSLNGGSGNTITNSTFASNRVTGLTAFGGGAHTTSSVTFTSSTIARNTAKQGGGILVDAATPTLRGTIVAQNTATAGKDCAGAVSSAGYNLIGSTSGCTFANVSTDRLNRIARLGLLRVERRRDADDRAPERAAPR